MNNSKRVFETDGKVLVKYNEMYAMDIGGAIAVPEGIEKIAQRAFFGAEITQLYLPESLCEIEEGAFSACQSLVSVKIPSNIVEIPDSAFSGCFNLKRIEMPRGLASIGRGAFAKCRSLTEISLPETVKFIGKQAFADCGGITSVYIPGSVDYIGEEAFAGCASLSEITVATENADYFGVDCIVEKESRKLIVGSKKGIIPSGVTRICARAFEGFAEIESVNIPDGVVCIEEYAFAHCKSLKSVHIPSSVTRIEIGAFAQNARGTEFFIDEANENFIAAGGHLIDKANKTLLVGVSYIPPGIKKLANGCFMYGDIERVTIPDTVEEIGERAFASCNRLKEIVIGINVKKLGKQAFKLCLSLENVKILSEQIDIPEECFAACGKLKNVQLSDGVRSIGDWAFATNISLEHINMPLSVQTIGDYAFSDSESLSKTDIDKIKASVPNISNLAFESTIPLILSIGAKQP